MDNKNPSTTVEADSSPSRANVAVAGGGGYAAKKSQKQLQRQERRAQELKEREAKEAMASSAAAELDLVLPPLQKLPENLPELPAIVFGTHMLQYEAAENAVYDALVAGYRGVDTASRYFNEEQVASAIKRSGVPREEIFLITKIGPQDTKKGRTAIIKSFLESLRKLETNYLDCYLMHWPGVGGIAPEDPAAVPKRIEAWKAMAELKRRGLVRYIGVSNYKLRHFLSLEEAAKKEEEEGEGGKKNSSLGEEDDTDKPTTKESIDLSSRRLCLSSIVSSIPIPDVHQTELHPLCKQSESSQYCFEKGIKLQQYSPLAKTDPRLFEHPSMLEAVDRLKFIFEKEKVALPSTSSTAPLTVQVAEPIEVTPSLVSLMWGRYKGYASAAVRSTNPKRIAANLLAPLIYDRCVAPFADRVGVLAELDAALANECDMHTCWESSKVY